MFSWSLLVKNISTYQDKSISLKASCNYRTKNKTTIISSFHSVLTETISSIEDFIRNFIRFHLKLEFFIDFLLISAYILISTIYTNIRVSEFIKFYFIMSVMKFWKQIKVYLSTSLFSWIIRFFFYCIFKFNIIFRIHTIKKDGKQNSRLLH